MYQRGKISTLFITEREKKEKRGKSYHTDISSNMSRTRTFGPTPPKRQGLCHPSPKWPRGTVHKGTLHAVFTWPQRPFLVLCVWKLAFKVATRRHLQPFNRLSPAPFQSPSLLLLLPLPALLQTGQDLVIYTPDIYRKFPGPSFYFLLSSSHSKTSLNLNNIIRAGATPVVCWNILQK